MSEQSLSAYSWALVGFMGLFWSLWYGLDPMLRIFDISPYIALKSKERQGIIKDILHLTHHLVVIFFALKVIAF